MKERKPRAIKTNEATKTEASIEFKTPALIAQRKKQLQTEILKNFKKHKIGIDLARSGQDETHIYKTTFRRTDSDFFETKFKLLKICMEYYHWKMVIQFERPIKKLHISYKASFIPNDSGFDTQINSERELMRDIRIDPQQDLFQEQRQARMEKHEENIRHIEKNRFEFLQNNPETHCDVSVAEFKNKDEVIVTFKIPPTVVEFLNIKRFNIADNYYLRLSNSQVEDCEIERVEEELEQVPAHK
ncbi:MAG: hypothetical protein V4549_03580 [Bacteroidota bacterium]